MEYLGTSLFKQGVRLFNPGSHLFERLKSARNRSTTCRDTEWMHGVSGWSTPCVLAFPVQSEKITRLHSIGECTKCVIKAPPGSRMQVPTDIMLCLHRDEYDRYRNLPNLSDDFMLCGGSEHLGIYDRLHWARLDNNLAPSCGRTCCVHFLRSSSSWLRSKQAHVWFCSEECCHFRYLWK